MMMAFAMSAALASQPANAGQPVAASDFDLSDQVSRGASPKQDRVEAVPPRNLDMRDFAIDAPEAQWRPAEGGPVFVVGAMGGRRAGMPKLAHVALDWSF